MDTASHLVHLRGQQLRAEAEAHRLAAACRRRTGRPSLAVRLYARLWWASRPRAAVWAPALFTTAEQAPAP